MRTAFAFATLAILATTFAPCGAELRGRGFAGLSQERSLLQTYDRELSGDSAAGKDTPVTRVVNLLKEMSATLSKEMEEDEALYHTLACWCNNGEYEKGEFIEATEAKISELQSTIESLTAKSAELATQIKELEAEVAADKAALAEATELREKEQQAFHGSELDSIQAIEQMKAALEVLSKHHGANAATPWMQSPAGSLLEVDTHTGGKKGKKDHGPWADEHEERQMSHALDDFMRHNDMPASDEGVVTAAASKAQQQFLQSQAAAGGAAGTSAAAEAGAWSAEESAVVRTALRAAAKFSREKSGEAYYPSYHAVSGEIVGVLKQLK
jgi:outer membrane murein-binding lipoprotein Lpp